MTADRSSCTAAIKLQLRASCEGKGKNSLTQAAQWAEKDDDDGDDVIRAITQALADRDDGSQPAGTHALGDFADCAAALCIHMLSLSDGYSGNLSPHAVFT